MTMSTATAERNSKSEPRDRVRTVEAIHRSTEFHWVGDGFHVSTYFPSSVLASERLSPFLLMDYGPPKEFHEERFTRQGGRMHMMQLWVNLRKKDKTAPPGYQPIVSAEIPQAQIEGGGTVRVIAGEYAGAHGPA